MISPFTDKTLQIAVQLGYFTFTEEMYGKTLGDLMTKPDVSSSGEYGQFWVVNE